MTFKVEFLGQFDTGGLKVLDEKIEFENLFSSSL
jgi:hypothetical protein